MPNVHRRATHARPAPLLACVLLLLVFAATTPADTVPLGVFSAMKAGGMPEGWTPLTFDARTPPTEYALVEDAGTVVVRARSHGGASGLVRPVEGDFAEYPVLAWRWKVDDVVAGGDVRSKSGDDYAARLYVTFDYDPSDLGFVDRLTYRALRALGYDNVPVRALNYIWASQAPAGAIVPNPYTDWVQMVVLQSGPARAGEWVMEARDVHADYLRAFGEPPPPISGVALMTDSDNTGGTATAYYGDVVLRARPSLP